mmetsp:Transcript_50055/g.157646  ORF Transcript_50055/g.157646 Transcript_50055/m.157646 type:complete len:1049 (-) Transcript_50055:206-3352(-)
MLSPHAVLAGVLAGVEVLRRLEALRKLPVHVADADGLGPPRAGAHAEGVQHVGQRVAQLPVVPVEGKDVAEDLVRVVVREHVEVLDQADQLAGGVRIRQRARVDHAAELAEEPQELDDGVLGHRGPVEAQELHLGGHVRSLHRVGGEDVPALPVEVVAEEGEARAVGEDDHPEPRGNGQQRGVVLTVQLRRHPAALQDRAAVPQRELAVLREALEDADDLQRRLVGLVDNEDPAVPHRGHQRRVFVDDGPAPQHGLQGQGLDGRVAMKLHVLPLASQELEKPVRQLVLAGALVAHQEQVVPERPVQQHLLQRGHVLRSVHKLNVWDELERGGPAHLAADAPDSEPVAVDLDRGRPAAVGGRLQARAPELADRTCAGGPHRSSEHVVDSLLRLRLEEVQPRRERAVRCACGVAPRGRQVLARAPQLAEAQCHGLQLLLVLGLVQLLPDRAREGGEAVKGTALLQLRLLSGLHSPREAELLELPDGQRGDLVEVEEAAGLRREPLLLAAPRGRLRHGYDPEGRVNHADPACQELLLREAASEQALKVLRRHQARTISKLDLAVMEETPERAVEHAFREPVHAIKDGHLPPKSCNQQGAALPRRVPEGVGGAPLQQVSRHHVLVAEDDMGLVAQKLAEGPDENRLADPSLSHEAYVHAHGVVLQHGGDKAALRLGQRCGTDGLHQRPFDRGGKVEAGTAGRPDRHRAARRPLPAELNDAAPRIRADGGETPHVVIAPVDKGLPKAAGLQDLLRGLQPHVGEPQQIHGVRPEQQPPRRRLRQHGEEAREAPKREVREEWGPLGLGRCGPRVQLWSIVEAHGCQELRQACQLAQCPKGRVAGADRTLGKPLQLLARRATEEARLQLERDEAGPQGRIEGVAAARLSYGDHLEVLAHRNVPFDPLQVLRPVRGRKERAVLQSHLPVLQQIVESWQHIPLGLLNAFQDQDPPLLGGRHRWLVNKLQATFHNLSALLEVCLAGIPRDCDVLELLPQEDAVQKHEVAKLGPRLAQEEHVLLEFALLHHPAQGLERAPRRHGKGRATRVGQEGNSCLI